MANCADDSQGLRELLCDKICEDYFGETTELRSRATILAVLQSSKLPPVKTLRDYCRTQRAGTPRKLLRHG